MIEVKIVEPAIGWCDAGGADNIGSFNDIVFCLFLQLLELQLLFIGKLFLLVDHFIVLFQFLVKRLTHVSQFVVKGQLFNIRWDAFSGFRTETKDLYPCLVDSLSQHIDDHVRRSTDQNLLLCLFHQMVNDACTRHCFASTGWTLD